MAIGSQPEIGVTFGVYGKLSDAEKAEWFRHMREVYGPDLLGGYATLHYPTRFPGGLIDPDE